eukprot:XP_001699456.1 predicted protein [Chlamydomonas reinhardtii]
MDALLADTNVASGQQAEPPPRRNPRKSGAGQRASRGGDSSCSPCRRNGCCLRRPARFGPAAPYSSAPYSSAPYSSAPWSSAPAPAPALTRPPATGPPLHAATTGPEAAAASASQRPHTFSPSSAAGGDAAAAADANADAAWGQSELLRGARWGGCVVPAPVATRQRSPRLRQQQQMGAAGAGAGAAAVTCTRQQHPHLPEPTALGAEPGAASPPAAAAAGNQGLAAAAVRASPGSAVAANAAAAAQRPASAEPAAAAATAPAAAATAPTTNGTSGGGRGVTRFVLSSLMRLQSPDDGTSLPVHHFQLRPNGMLQPPPSSSPPAAASEMAAPETPRHQVVAAPPWAAWAQPPQAVLRPLLQPPAELAHQQHQQQAQLQATSAPPPPPGTSSAVQGPQAGAVAAATAAAAAPRPGQTTATSPDEGRGATRRPVDSGLELCPELSALASLTRLEAHGGLLLPDRRPVFGVLQPPTALRELQLEGDGSSSSRRVMVLLRPDDCLVSHSRGDVAGGGLLLAAGEAALCATAAFLGMLRLPHRVAHGVVLEAADVEALRQHCSSLEELSTFDCPMPLACLPALAAMPRLTQLDLDLGPWVPDDRRRPLRRMRRKGAGAELPEPLEPELQQAVLELFGVRQRQAGSSCSRSGAAGEAGAGGGEVGNGGAGRRLRSLVLRGWGEALPAAKQLLEAAAEDMRAAGLDPGSVRLEEHET